jgi:hypothetical protein
MGQQNSAGGPVRSLRGFPVSAQSVQWQGTTERHTWCPTFRSNRAAPPVMRVPGPLLSGQICSGALWAVRPLHAFHRARADDPGSRRVRWDERLGDLHAEQIRGGDPSRHRGSAGSLKSLSSMIETYIQMRIHALLWSRPGRRVRVPVPATCSLKARANTVRS